MAENALHGVNLTGWLTLEPWVTPELFSGSGALDEPSLITSLGAKGYREVVRRHRARFLTKDDFSRIASRGFNAVRLPVPWYVFGVPILGTTWAALTRLTRRWSGPRRSTSR